VLWFVLRPTRRELLDWIACFVLTVLVAALVWMPFYISLQSSGGYGPIAANHARYVVGFTGWLESAQRQMTNQFALGHSYSFLGLVLAMLLPRLLQPQRWNDVLVHVGKSLFEALGVLVLTATFVLSIGAVVGIGRQALALHHTPKQDEVSRRRAIGLVLVAVWWGAMLVATPLYTPYPRLALSLVLAACLATAMNWPPIAGIEKDKAELGIGWSVAALIAWIGLGLLMTYLQPHQDWHNHSADRRGIMHIAEQIRATGIRGEPRVVYSAGEPSIFFQLTAAGEPIAAPVPFVPREPATKDGLPIPTFIVVGPHANRDPQFQEQWAAAKGKWKLVQEFDCQPSAVVWLDLNDPRQSPQATRDLDRVRLYRLKP
jgi:hypothetical protein